MSEYLVAKSIAYAFPDTPLAWAITQSNYSTAQADRDGIVFSDSGEFEVTLEVTSGDENAVFTSVDGTILNEVNAVDLSERGKDFGRFCVRYRTKIRAGSTLSVWVKKDSDGVHRGAVLVIRKLP